MIEEIISKFCDVELLEYLEGDDDIEITLYDKLNKGICFEQDISAIVNELEKLYYKISYEVYNPINKEEEGYEMIFVRIIK